ncbi:hypothetical protein ACFQZI_12305 [Mucilaginibacter lutimaris]|uniref:Translation elongation factor EFTu/EF1A C-terminal domain-containing protein n=1 Tax=Mucilaginibacter lutimaris TaxID=931629 RepID=A0ABW2ZHL7_9SPHI
MDKQPDFIAEVKYLTTEEGGRKTPAFSGYRPHLKFPMKDYLTSGQQKFLDAEIVYPGGRVKAEIAMIATDIFAGLLEPGMHFEFGEGPHIIGTGIILEIINPILLKQ